MALFPLIPSKYLEIAQGSLARCFSLFLMVCELGEVSLDFRDFESRRCLVMDWCMSRVRVWVGTFLLEGIGGEDGSDVIVRY